MLDFIHSYKVSIRVQAETWLSTGKRWKTLLAERIANGLVGAVAAILELATHQEIYAVAFLGCIAAAMSDTVATEIGLLSTSKPRLIFQPRKIVAPGTSGGVSGLGEMAGSRFSYWSWRFGRCSRGCFRNSSGEAYTLIAVVVAAFLAMNFDSLLGATVQGKNKCRVCGGDTENLYHHGEPTISEKGIRFLDNNVVNLVGNNCSRTDFDCTVSSAYLLKLLSVEAISEMFIRDWDIESRSRKVTVSFCKVS